MQPISSNPSNLTEFYDKNLTIIDAIEFNLPLESILNLCNSHSINKKSCGRYPLDVAIATGNIPLTEKLLELGAKFSDKAIVFLFALTKGSTKILEALIKGEGLDTNRVNQHNPLMIAMSKDDVANVRLLLENGASPFIGSHGTTPCQLASVGSLELIQVLVKSGKIDINYRYDAFRLDNKWGLQTFLHLCSTNKDPKVVQWLLEIGGNPSIVDRDGKTPIEYAFSKKLEDNVIKFIEKESDINKLYGSYKRTALALAAVNGMFHAVKSLLEKEADLLIPDSAGHTPLCLACASGNLSVVKLLYTALEKKNLPIDFNEKFGPNEVTYLDECVFNENTEVVEWLLDKGANPLLLCVGGRTPLAIACEEKNWKNAQLFVTRWKKNPSHSNTYEADLNKKYDVNEAPLLLGVTYHGIIDLVREFLAKGADHTIPDNRGFTPFYFACAMGHLNIAKLLYENWTGTHPFDIHATYGAGEITVLQAATLIKDVTVVKWLLTLGANPFKDIKGGSPFILACFNHNVDIINAFMGVEGIIDKEIVNFTESALPFVKTLLEAGIPLSTFNLSTRDQSFNESIRKRMKLLEISSFIINDLISNSSKRISEKFEELIALDVEEKLTPFKECQLSLVTGQELLDQFLPFFYKAFPELNSIRKGLISIHSNGKLFRVFQEVLIKYKWLHDIQLNEHIKLKVKFETTLDKIFEFVITLYNNLQNESEIVKNSTVDNKVALKPASTVAAVAKPAEPTPQIKPAKPQHSLSNNPVLVPNTNTQKKPVKNKKGKGKQKQKGSAPKPQVITTAAHQKEHPSQVILAEPLPPLFPPQMIPLKTPSFDLESLLVDSSQPHKEDHQLSELKKILSNPEPLHLSLFDEVCKINRDHHQVPGFFAFDSWLIHSSHKIFHSDVMCDLFLQFVKQGYQDPFKPEQLLESFSTKHFVDELAKIDGDRKQTIRNMIKILPSLSSRHAISAAIMIIGEQTARSTDELSDIIDICMKYKVYRNLRHRLENQPEPVPFEREGVIEEGLINAGIDWEEMLNELINELPADLEKLKNSKIMKE